MTAAKAKKTEDTNIDNINDVNNQEGESEMNNGTTTQTVIANGNGHINGNGYSNGNGYKLSEIRPIDLTLEEFGNLSPDGKMSEDLLSLVIPRLSRIRTKNELVSRIRDGKIRITKPNSISNWTYGNVTIEGMSINSNANISSRVTKNPKVVLSQEEFDALTDIEKSELIGKYTRERRAITIFETLLRLGMQLTAYDVVYLTCGRLSIEGIVVEGHSKKQVAIVDGIEFE